MVGGARSYSAYERKKRAVIFFRHSRSIHKEGDRRQTIEYRGIRLMSDDIIDDVWLMSVDKRAKKTSSMVLATR